MRADATTPGLRRAALTLHALHAADRAWLLKQLAPDARNALQRLLDELNRLRLPRDRELIRAALQASKGDAALAADAARALGRVLTDQPPRLQGLLLCALPAPERKAFLQHWSSAHIAPTADTKEPAWTSALQDAVLQCWTDLSRTPEARK